jgi:hypothetical protein
MSQSNAQQSTSHVKSNYILAVKSFILLDVPGLDKGNTWSAFTLFSTTRTQDDFNLK